MSSPNVEGTRNSQALSGGDFGVQLQSFTKATLPTGASAGAIAYCSDATGAHVTGSLVFFNGTSYIDVTTGIAVV